MKKSDFFDNLNIIFAESEENEDYAFTKAVVYRDLETGEIESVQIMNTEYREFMVVDREGEISFVNMDEEENEALMDGGKSGKKKRK